MIPWKSMKLDDTTVWIVCTHSLFEVGISEETDVSTRVPNGHQAVVRVDSHAVDLVVTGLLRAPQPAHTHIHRARLWMPFYRQRVQFVRETEIGNIPWKYWNNITTVNSLIWFLVEIIVTTDQRRFRHACNI